MVMSAVASSTAVGVLETRTECEVQAWMSTWSYPAPWNYQLVLVAEEDMGGGGVGGIDTVVADKLETLGHVVQHLAVNLARYGDRVKGSVGDGGAVKGSRLAFLEKLVAVGGLGGEDFGDGGDGCPCIVGAEKWWQVVSVSAERLVSEGRPFWSWSTYWSICPRRRTLGFASELIAAVCGVVVEGKRNVSLGPGEWFLL